MNPQELTELKDQLKEIRDRIRHKKDELEDLQLEEDDLMNMIELAEERAGMGV